MLGTVLDAEDAKIRVYSPVGRTDIEADKFQVGAGGQGERQSTEWEEEAAGVGRCWCLFKNLLCYQ